jgi:hypothetical protein
MYACKILNNEKGRGMKAVLLNKPCFMLFELIFQTNQKNRRSAEPNLRETQRTLFLLLV